jgi:hypothetical protein
MYTKLEVNSKMAVEGQHPVSNAEQPVHGMVISRGRTWIVF